MLAITILIIIFPYMKVYHLQQDSLPDIQIDVTKRGLQRFRYKETNKHVFSSFTSVPTHDRIQFLCSKLCSGSASPRHKVYSSQHISVPPPTHLAVSVHSPLIYLPWMITWASSLLSFFPISSCIGLSSLPSQRKTLPQSFKTHESCAVENGIC